MRTPIEFSVAMVLIPHHLRLKRRLLGSSELRYGLIRVLLIGYAASPEKGKIGKLNPCNEDNYSLSDLIYRQCRKLTASPTQPLHHSISKSLSRVSNQPIGRQDSLFGALSPQWSGSWGSRIAFGTKNPEDGDQAVIQPESGLFPGIYVFLLKKMANNQETPFEVSFVKIPRTVHSKWQIWYPMGPFKVLSTLPQLSIWGPDNELPSPPPNAI